MAEPIGAAAVRQRILSRENRSLRAECAAARTKRRGDESSAERASAALEISLRALRDEKRCTGGFRAALARCEHELACARTLRGRAEALRKKANASCSEENALIGKLSINQNKQNRLALLIDEAAELKEARREITDELNLETPCSHSLCFSARTAESRPASVGEPRCAPPAGTAGPAGSPASIEVPCSTGGSECLVRVCDTGAGSIGVRITGAPADLSWRERDRLKRALRREGLALTSFEVRSTRRRER